MNIKRHLKDNVKFNESEMAENLKCIEKEINNKKQLPIDQVNKINKKIFENMLIADFVIAFLLFISLESLNIETSIFIRNLKIFSIMLILFTVAMFEYSYSKENVNIFVHGLECFFLSLFTLLSTYLYAIYFRNFQFIVVIATLIATTYFILKSLTIYLWMRKKYFNSLNDINKIIER